MRRLELEGVGRSWEVGGWVGGNERWGEDSETQSLLAFSIRQAED